MPPAANLRTCCTFVIFWIAQTAFAQLDPDFRREDFTSGQCASGGAQSPINISSTSPLSRRRSTKLVLPTVNSTTLENKGTALQVEWSRVLGGPSRLPRVPTCGNAIADCLTNPRAPVTKTVRVEPIQFHFHTPSEHTTDGFYYAAETHIVTLIDKGERPEWGCDTRPPTAATLARCAMVFATLYKIGNDSPAWFEDAFALADREFESSTSWDSRFDLTNLAPPSSYAHYEYAGSLTTPPCTEAVRWFVFEEPRTITPETMREMEQFMAYTYEVVGETKVENIYLTNRRELQPLNGRTIYRATDVASRP